MSATASRPRSSTRSASRSKRLEGGSRTSWYDRPRPSGSLPFTPRAKKALELSLREALALGHSYIGTEHILLGIVREGDGVAAQMLVSLGADLGRVRQLALQMMSGNQSKEPVGSHTQQIRSSGRRAEDALLLRLLWNSKMIRDPENEAEQSVWDELKERFEPSSDDEP
jgi:ATP-dependent Clp protease ATP-binding subunit ClpA